MRAPATVANAELTSTRPYIFCGPIAVGQRLPAAPAQIRAGAADAHGSYLGSMSVWRQESDKRLLEGEDHE